MLPPAAILTTLLALVLLGCGESQSAGNLAKTPPSFLAGVDEDAPIPGRPGYFRKHILTRGYKLNAMDINVHTARFRIGIFGSGEPAWITAWESNTEDPEGNREPDDIHCHSQLTDEAVVQDDGQVFTGLFTDGFTPVMRLPEGFGIPVPRGRRMWFAPMFNNRRPTARVSRMRLKIDYLPQALAKKPMRALRSYTLRVAQRDFYWIKAGKIDTRTRVVEAPFAGRVHSIGGHIHPYGDFVELKRERTNEVLFTAKLRKDGKIEDQRLDTYSSVKGFYVARGEPLRITTVYTNDTDATIDAMGGLFMLYDPEGKPDA